MQVSVAWTATRTESTASAPLQKRDAKAAVRQSPAPLRPVSTHSASITDTLPPTSHNVANPPSDIGMDVAMTISGPLRRRRSHARIASSTSWMSRPVIAASSNRLGVITVAFEGACSAKNRAMLSSTYSPLGSSPQAGSKMTGPGLPRSFHVVKMASPCAAVPKYPISRARGASHLPQTSVIRRCNVSGADTIRSEGP